MTSLPRRAAMLGFAALLAASAAGCDSEDKQAAELQKFLQTRLLDRQGAGLPRPNDQERQSFGRFAADYDIILAFNQTMNASVTGKIGDVMRRGSFSRAQDFLDRKDDIATAREALRSMEGALGGALKEAGEARSRLKQPEALKAVYDRAFERAITRPAEIMREVFPAADKVFAQGLDFSEFLNRNKTDLKFSGILVETTKPALQTEFNRRAQEMSQAGTALLDAQRKLQAMVRGQ